MKQSMIVFLCQREKQLTAVCNLQLKDLSELNCTSESSGERSVSELDQLEFFTVKLSALLPIDETPVVISSHGSGVRKVLNEPMEYLAV